MDYQGNTTGAQSGNYADFIEHLRQSLETGAQAPDPEQFSGYGVTPLEQTASQLQRIAGQ